MVKMVKMVGTELDVFPLCLGGNVLGWTADERDSFAVLDEYRAAGGNFVDTADAYMAMVPGLSGGESESVLGQWMAARRNRDSMIIATKVGKLPALSGLSPLTIHRAVEGSLRRLQTDYIDLYFAHFDDVSTPLEKTLGAFDALVRGGKVRYIGMSNFTAKRLADALSISTREGLARPVALQPHYNLLERETYEDTLADLCAREHLSVLPYFALATGFLTGKYRPGGPTIASPRAESAAAYLDTARGRAVLSALDEVSTSHRVPPASVSLAWLRTRPMVTAPIASARTTDQLAELLPMVDLDLSGNDLEILDRASRTES